MVVIGVGAESTGGLKGFPESPVSVRVDAWVNGIDEAESTGGLKVFPKSLVVGCQRLESGSEGSGDDSEPIVAAEVGLRPRGDSARLMLSSMVAIGVVGK